MSIITKPIGDLRSDQQREAVAFAVSASRVDAYCIGWLPTKAYHDAQQTNRLIFCWNNNDLVGFVLWGTPIGRIQIYQVWVRRDARMIVHGRSLVDAVCSIGRAITAHELLLWCAEDLEANLFWAALGFEKRTWRHGTGKSRRRHVMWTQDLTRREHTPQEQSNGQPAPLASPTPQRFHSRLLSKLRTTLRSH